LNTLLRIVASSAALTLLGAGLLPCPAGSRYSAGWRAYQLAAGAAVAAPLFLLLGAAGMPITETTVLLGILALAGALWFFRRGRRVLENPISRKEISPWHGLLLAAVLVFSWKVLVVPLWSWDHHVIWGMKSRRMVQAGKLELGLLKEPGFSAQPEYPLGLPMLWRLFTFGEIPDAASVKLAHLLLGFGVAAALNRLLVQRGLSPLQAAAWTSLAAISPLFWDTESVGGADLALSFFAISGVALLLEPLTREGRFAAGLVVGALPWIKTEGAVLALWILLGDAILRRDKRASSAVLAGSALAVAVLLGFHAIYLPTTPTFVEGDWWGRLTARIVYSGFLLRDLAKTLVHEDWIGAWILFGVGWLNAFFRKVKAAIVLGGIVIGQSLFYAATYLATYLDPIDHVRSSFHRIMAALLPIAVAATAVALFGQKDARPAVAPTSSSA
jgi:hypothetical protein